MTVCCMPNLVNYPQVLSTAQDSGRHQCYSHSQMRRPTQGQPTNLWSMWLPFHPTMQCKQNCDKMVQVPVQSPTHCLWASLGSNLETCGKVLWKFSITECSRFEAALRVRPSLMYPANLKEPTQLAVYPPTSGLTRQPHSLPPTDTLASITRLHTHVIFHLWLRKLCTLTHTSEISDFCHLTSWFLPILLYSSFIHASPYTATLAHTLNTFITVLFTHAFQLLLLPHLCLPGARIKVMCHPYWLSRLYAMACALSYSHITVCSEVPSH